MNWIVWLVIDALFIGWNVSLGVMNLHVHRPGYAAFCFACALLVIVIALYTLPTLRRTGSR